MIKHNVKNPEDAFNEDGSIKIENMREFVSEIFREYWLDPAGLKNRFPAYYNLIEDALR